jgi:glycerol-3-phosphate dehydrogenase
LGDYAISTPERARTLDALERDSFDVIVIGGGISGAGIAREAALRGASIALLEAADFACGTSSKSSKLIHGGLRYLALGDVTLVRETALERKAIHRLAPHLAEPRWVVVPTRSRAGLMKFRVAIDTYEKLGRLVLANLRAAVAAGALALNHARVDRILVERGRASGVEAECGLTGRRVRVQARAVINAAGPWVEAVRRLEDASAPPLLVLSKGVHLSIRAERLPVNNMVIFYARDGRSVFAIRRGPAVYLGTTDTLYEPGETYWPEITSDDVEYLLEPLPRSFAIEPVKPEEVVGAWAGLRPLISEPGKKTTEISRRDEVLIGPARVVTVAGGKLTGYRPMARRSLDDAARVAGLRLAPAPEPGPPLAGGDFDGDLDRLAAELRRESGVREATAARLVRLYGSEAADVAALGSEPVVPGADVIRGEIDWAVAEEGAARVIDVVYRRTRAAYYDPDARNRIAEPVAERMAELLGWDEERRVKEIELAEARLNAELAFARPGA